MAKFPTHGEKAWELYRKNRTLEEISEILGVSVTALSEWSQRYNWPEKREELRNNPQAIQEKIVKVIAKKLEDADADDFTAADADVVSKMSKAAKDFGDTEDFPKRALEIMSNFSDYISGSEMTDEKKTTCFEAIQDYLSTLEHEIYE